MNKQCAKCQQWKSGTDFYHNNRSKDGLTSYCKACNIQSAAEFQKTPKGQFSLKKAIKKKQDAGYYRFGKGAISILRQGAAKRKIAFSLSSEELECWWLTTPDICEYCGTGLDDYIWLRDFVIGYDGFSWNILKFKRFFRSPKHAHIKWMTIDRKDNSEGYRVTNMAKACWFCNSLKNDFFDAAEMRAIVPGVISRLKAEVKKTEQRKLNDSTESTDQCAGQQTVGAK
jgi:hypothetical protein